MNWLLVVGIGQMVVGAVGIWRVLRAWRGSPRRRDLRGQVVLVVAGWAGFGLVGLVLVVQAL
jgi:hypothetical protein